MASSSLRPVLRVLGMDKFVLLSVRVLAGGAVLLAPVLHLVA